MNLLASISPTSGGYLASFISAGAPFRRPAIRCFPSFEAARDFILGEAEAVRADVKWTPPEIAARVSDSLQG